MLHVLHPFFPCVLRVPPIAWKRDFSNFYEVLEKVGIDVLEGAIISDKLERAILGLPTGSPIKYIEKKSEEIRREMVQRLLQHEFSFLDTGTITSLLVRRLTMFEIPASLNKKAQMVLLTEYFVRDLDKQKFSSKEIKKILYTFIDVLKVV